MNSLVSADYGSSSDSASDDENTIETANFHRNNVKNFLRSASDDSNDDDDDNDSNSSSERSKSKYVWENVNARLFPSLLPPSHSPVPFAICS